MSSDYSASAKTSEISCLPVCSVFPWLIHVLRPTQQVKSCDEETSVQNFICKAGEVWGQTYGVFFTFYSLFMDIHNSFMDILHHIHNSFMDIPNSFMYIHNSFMYIHDSFMDVLD